jgi:hypothetical protein
MESKEISRQLASGIDRLQIGRGDVVAKEHVRAERPRVVAAHEPVNVPHVVGLEHGDHGRRARIEPSPDLVCIPGWGEWIHYDDFAA